MMNQPLKFIPFSPPTQAYFGGHPQYIYAAEKTWSCGLGQRSLARPEKARQEFEVN